MVILVRLINSSTVLPMCVGQGPKVTEFASNICDEMISTIHYFPSKTIVYVSEINFTHQLNTCLSSKYISENRYFYCRTEISNENRSF